MTDPTRPDPTRPDPTRPDPTRAATPLDVLEGRARWCVVEGDAMAVLASLPDSCIDAVVTDPPYSSGGFTRADRTASTDAKYTQTEAQGKRPDFTGDSRSQRAFILWCSLWMEEARRASTADGRIVTFTDWRQLACMCDAVECGGWIFRGIVPWDKGGGRPVAGGFRSRCEYVVWGSTGPLPLPHPGVTCLDGLFAVTVRQDDKHHQTGKPTALMRELVKVAPPGGVVLDPFGGSGTTGVAALAEGRRAIIVERTPEYAAIARQRCISAAAMASLSRLNQPTSLRVPPPPRR